MSNKQPKGRKFAVVIMATILLGIGMIAGVIGALEGVDLPWLAMTLPIIASTYPAYIGGNAMQKIKTAPQQSKGDK